MRKVIGHLAKADADWVLVLIRSIFNQATAQATRAQFHEVVRALEKRHGHIATMLEEAEEELLAYSAFPQVHWRQIWSSNPLERLNRGIKRRIDVVGIFPNRPAAIGLIGALLMEQDDEWLAARRYLSAASMATALTMPQLTQTEVSEEP